jgi:hypothetical protein
MRAREHMTRDKDTRRRKTIGTILLVCTLAAVIVTLTVEGRWVFIGCAAFLVAVAIALPLVLPRARS